MRRYELEDRHWDLIKGVFPRTSRGRYWKDHRVIVNGIFWILFSGAPWRDLPERYGSWQTAHRRFTLWRRDGTWDKVLTKLQLKADRQGLLDYARWNIDSTSIRAAKASAGAKKRDRYA